MLINDNAYASIFLLMETAENVCLKYLDLGSVSLIDRLIDFDKFILLRYSDCCSIS